MFCKPCKETGQPTLWGTTGVESFRRDALVNHERGSSKAKSKKGQGYHAQALSTLESRKKNPQAKDISEPVSNDSDMLYFVHILQLSSLLDQSDAGANHMLS